MKRYLTTAALLLSSLTSHAEQILFESGTLGPTGLASGEVTSASVNAFVFAGAQFQLTGPTQITEIGGHFLGTGTFFGAIVELDDNNDVPDTVNLSSSDVLGTTLLTFPNTSSEVFGGLPLLLPPGDYAVVFGSGLFDADGEGGAPINNPLLGTPTFLSAQPGSGIDTWVFRLPQPGEDVRLVVTGFEIPEPGAALLLLGALLISSASQQRER